MALMLLKKFEVIDIHGNWTWHRAIGRDRRRQSVQITGLRTEKSMNINTTGDIKRVLQGARNRSKMAFNLRLWFQRLYQRLKTVPDVVVTTGILNKHYRGPYDGKPNPHARMSPDNALIYVDNIRDAAGEKYDREMLKLTKPMRTPINKRSVRRLNRCVNK